MMDGEIFQFEYDENIGFLKKEFEKKQRKVKKPISTGYFVAGTFILVILSEILFWGQTEMFSKTWYMIQIMTLILVAVIQVGMWFGSKSAMREKCKWFEMEIAKKAPNHIFCTFEQEYFKILTCEYEKKEYCIWYSSFVRVSENDYLFQMISADSNIVFRKEYLSYDEIDRLRKQLLEKCNGVYRRETTIGDESSIYFRIFCKDKSKKRQQQRKNVWLYRQEKENYSDKRYLGLLVIGICVIATCVRIVAGQKIGIFDDVLVFSVLYVFLMRYVLMQKANAQIALTEQSWSMSKMKFYWADVQLVTEVQGAFILVDHTKRSPYLIWKDVYSERDILRIRQFLKKTLQERYQYEEIFGYVSRNNVRKNRVKEWLICIACILGLGFLLMRCSLTSEPAWNPPVTDNFGIQDSIAKPDDSKGNQSNAAWSEEIYIEVADKDDLHLNVKTLRIEDCYITNDANDSSHFVIQNGTLRGASANENGELGLGHCEPDYDARGYMRYEEIAENVKHIALNSKFMLYLTEDNQMWGTGDVPGVGSCLTPTLLMEHVTYMNCGSSSILILKEDGTAWIVGNLGEDMDYPEYTQVMDKVKYVCANANTAAVIREDNTLWMWGDNEYEQCGIRDGVLDVLQVKEPTQVMDDVKVIWMGNLRFNSSVREMREPFEGVSVVGNEVYIQKTDSTLWAFGGQASAKEHVFVPLEIVEE